MPIFGVRGLNSGFDDAFNLGWKLALVLDGRSPQRLLDTYSEERIHGFEVNAASAIKSTEFMAPPSRGFTLMREAALSLAVSHPQIATVVNPRQTGAITYDRSSLNLASDDLGAGPVPGGVLSECPVRGPLRAAHLTDVVGPHFTAIVFAADGVPAQALDACLREFESGPLPWRTCVVSAVGEPAAVGARWRLVDDGGRAAATYGAFDGAVYLVRPDGHVAGRWRAPTAAHLRAGVAHLLGND
jgi:3-(3-hydroxy-phenyl)propionate hydroxylase